MRIKGLLFQISAVLILLSAVLYLWVPLVAPWIMAFSVALFSVMIVSHPYSGKDFRKRRLYGFQIIACLLMMVSTYLMFRHRNEWALTMICGAVFLLYSVLSGSKKGEQR